ncbi:ABC transporter permease [Rhodococcus qingshengii]|uniref:ABC transporter permease n=1 Tax=Rhodococcus qingshengii TaxID=334542 RepID=UPI0036DA1180
MAIASFIGKRLASMVALLLVISFLVFSLLSLSPGSAIAVLVGTRPSTPELIASLEAQHHLNDSFLAQYWHWMVDAVRLDFGRSTRSGAPVTGIIADHLPVSIQLAVYAVVLVLVIGVPSGMLAAYYRDKWVDRGISLSSVVGMSAPGFAVGILMIFVFGLTLGMFPVYGAGSGFYDRLVHLTLPAISLGIALTALLTRQTRAGALNVLRQDFMTFAKARGLSPTRIFFRYALRNSALPVVTAAGLMLIVALSGAVLIETVFSIPGVGSLMVQSVTEKDLPVVQGLTVCLAAFVIVVNLAVDVITLVVDPRMRYAGKG